MRPMFRSAAVFALLSVLLSGQNKTQEQFVELRKEKLAKSVFQKADWMLDYDAARAKAVATNKPIFAYFTRSYAH